MKDFSLRTKLYLLATLALGIVLLVWNLQYLNPDNWLMLLILMVLASLTLVIKVEGATERSHYSINFLVYGFSLFHLGIAETILVIVVSNFVEWFWWRQNWYGSSFNTACYIIAAQATFLTYHWVNPSGDTRELTSVVGIVFSMVVFILLNHLMIGIIIWLTSGENFAQSGIFDLLPLIIDLTLLVFGASLSLVWDYNPFIIGLFLLPLYLIYSTLRVPALERKTEIDQKTGVYNHAYFMEHLENELARANRFDRPLTVIMGDLDLLRNINNTYGHLAGDEVLKGIAKILKESVREYDVVARFGGEEFAILMPETESLTAYKRAEAIRKTVQIAEFTVPTSVEPIHATISFGLATRRNANQTSEEIIHNADIVLYHSKLKGRNRTHIYVDGELEDLPSPEAGVTPSSELEDDHIMENQQLEEAEQAYSAAYRHHKDHASPSTPTDAVSSPVEESFSEAKDGQIGHSTTAAEANQNRLLVNGFITAIVSASLILFSILFQQFSPDQLWGLILFASLVALTEWFSVEFYVRETAVSTSAVPVLAGSLLFGPVGALVLSLTFAVTAYLKFRGPLSRVLFNAANQLFAAMLYLGILEWFSITYLEWDLVYQLIFCLVAMFITFFVTTIFISIGMSFINKESFQNIWRTQFSWLIPYYVVMGMMAYALIFGYISAGYVGVILIIIPLLMLRISQEQYIGRTKKIVVELREKNLKLERNANEIADINNGLLETLAEVIDLRDAYVLNHSHLVTNFAVRLAQELGLPSRQVEVIRQASLLHDVGKLGIPETILGKPDTLTVEEFETIKEHPEIGARLLEKSVALRNLIPIVRYHHERFDGNGYPEGLKGTEIPLEARIVAVADSVDAMASERPYHGKHTREEIVEELKRCSGSQFDPEIVPVAVKLIRSKKVF